MKPKGFTLVEVTVVVLILGVLLVSVFPKVNSGGFSAVTEQQQVISILRNIQNRAMQNTQDGTCQGVYISSTNIGLAQLANDGSCNLAFEEVSTSIKGFLNLKLENDFVAQNASGTSISSIEFDNWGRPELYNISSERIGAIITIDASYSVCVESEGFIHEC